MGKSVRCVVILASLPFTLLLLHLSSNIQEDSSSSFTPTTLYSKPSTHSYALNYSSESVAVSAMKNPLEHKRQVGGNSEASKGVSEDEGKDIEDVDLGDPGEEIELFPPPPVLFPGGAVNVSTKAKFDRLMLSRRGRLKRKCGDNSPKSSYNPRVFYPLKTSSMAWCPVYKAASTNWMHNLLLMANMYPLQSTEALQPSAQGRLVAPALPYSQLRLLTKKSDFRGLIIVRHPFDRLLSAYRDKLERCHGPEPPKCTLEKDWYFQTYGRKIVSKHRPRAIQRFGQDNFSKRNNFGSPVAVGEGSWRSSDLPSWWEFVQYLIATPPTRYDEHWKPASLYCSPCSFPYNRILHFETLQGEEKHFLAEMRVKPQEQPRWQNRPSRDLSTEQLLNRYFSQLDDDDISALYSIYRDDFQLFGYQFEYRGLRLGD